MKDNFEDLVLSTRGSGAKVQDVEKLEQLLLDDPSLFEWFVEIEEAVDLAEEVYEHIGGPEDRRVIQFPRKEDSESQVVKARFNLPPRRVVVACALTFIGFSAYTFVDLSQSHADVEAFVDLDLPMESSGFQVNPEVVQPEDAQLSQGQFEALAAIDWEKLKGKVHKGSSYLFQSVAKLVPAIDFSSWTVAYEKMCHSDQEDLSMEPKLDIMMGDTNQETGSNVLDKVISYDFSESDVATYLVDSFANDKIRHFQFQSFADLTEWSSLGTSVFADGFEVATAENAFLGSVTSFSGSGESSPFFRLSSGVSIREVSDFKSFETSYQIGAPDGFTPFSVSSSELPSGTHGELTESYIAKEYFLSYVEYNSEGREEILMGITDKVDSDNDGTPTRRDLYIGFLLLEGNKVTTDLAEMERMDVKKNLSKG